MSTSLKPLMAALLVLAPLTGFVAGRWSAPSPAMELGPVLHELASQRALLEGHLVRRSREDARVRCAAGVGAVSELAPGALAQLKTELVQGSR